MLTLAVSRVQPSKPSHAFCFLSCVLFGYWILINASFTFVNLVFKFQGTLKKYCFFKWWLCMHIMLFQVKIMVIYALWSFKFAPRVKLVPQLMFLGQICPYTYVVLHNTMWLMLSLPLAISSPSQSACLAVVQQVIKHVHDILMWSRLD